MKRWIFRFVVLVLVFFITMEIFVRMREKRVSNERTMIVSLNGPPYSSDPIDYDAFVHHIAFRSVYSSVITQYHVGNFIGLLADSWISDESFRFWEFKIHIGMKFENGDLISPEIIVRSWTRLAFLMKQKGSRSAFFDSLEGIDRIKSPTTQISGLTYEGDRIKIRLKNPAKNLLDTLSFGLYAVVHPNDYDSVTGKWKNLRKVTASGPYRISKWENDSIEIERRTDYTLKIGHSSPIKKIRLVWNPDRRGEADLVMGNSIDTDVRKKHIFYGGANSSIAYARCRSWKISTSPCSDKAIRIALRESYYSELEKRGIRVTRSFFPLAIKGVKELISPKMKASTAFKGTVKFAHSTIPNPLFIAFNEAAPRAVESVGLQAEKIDLPFGVFMKEYDQNLAAYIADIYMLATGILIEDPVHDVRFMFLSQEGIRLPDVDGSIHIELNDEHPNIQRINEILWEQAVIWPISHYASGFWATDDFDFSQLNLLLPPSDFQWLGWK